MGVSSFICLIWRGAVRSLVALNLPSPTDAPPRYRPALASVVGYAGAFEQLFAALGQVQYTQVFAVFAVTLAQGF